MSDQELATRAPESDAQEDAQEDALVSSTTAANEPKAVPQGQQPIAEEDDRVTVSEHCTTDRPTPSNLPQPAGELSSIEDVACYVSKPASYPSSPCKLLLLLTSGTGIHSVNNQLQADAFAARGFVVVMPDQFGGDPAPRMSKRDEPSEHAGQPQSATSAATSNEVEQMSWLDRIKLGAAETAKSFMIDMWLARHDVHKVLPIIQKALNGAIEMFGDAVANGNGVYGVGYCFGAKYAMLLAGNGTGEPKSAFPGARQDGSGEEADKLKEPQLRAIAVAHGTLIAKVDIEGIRSPTAMVCVANDSLFPDEIREHGKTSLETNGVDHEIKVFDDCPHGFAVVGEYGDESIRTKQLEAFETMCSWLEAH